MRPEISQPVLSELPVRVTYKPNPFEPRQLVMVRAMTIDQVLAELEWKLDAKRTAVYLGDRRVPWWLFPLVTPKPGAIVTVVGIPTDPATLAAIAVFIAKAAGVVANVAGFIAQGIATVGTFLGPGGFAILQAVGTAALSIGGNLLLTSLTKPSDSTTTGLSKGRTLPPTVRGAGNEIRQYAPVPEIFGTHRVFPPLASLPFTETAGSLTFIRMLFVVGHGPLTISDVRIGESPVGVFDDVDTETREGRASDGPLAIYSNTVRQNLGLGFTFPTLLSSDPAPLESPFQQTTITGTDLEEIGLTISFPTGLIFFNENSKRRVMSLEIDIDYKKTTDGTWLSAPTVSSFGPFGGDGNVKLVGTNVKLTGFQTDPFIKAFRWKVPKADSYDIRVKRVEIAPRNALPGGGDNSQTLATFQWLSAKAFQFVPPIAQDLIDGANRVATFALRLPITDQIGGFVQTVNMLASGEHRIYDPDGISGAALDSDNWTTTPVPTNNPAAHYRHIFQGLLPEALPDTSLDVPALSDWYDRNEEAGLLYERLWDALGNLTLGNATARLDRIELQEGIASFEGTSDSASTASVRDDLWTAATDLTGVVMRFWVRPDTTNILSSSGGIEVRILSGNGATGFWVFGTNDGLASDTWKRLEIDFDTFPPESESGGSFDKTDVDEYRLFWNTVSSGSGQIANFDGVQFYRKTDMRQLHAEIASDFTAHELADTIAASGRASFHMEGGKVSVVVDHGSKVAVQLITPRNASAFNVQQRFGDNPHGLKMRFIDSESGYDPTREITVLDDGFTEETATRFETVELFGAWTPERAWKEGRYFIAANRLRPRLFSVDLDVEALVASRGDLVKFAHDGALIGQSWSRIVRLDSEYASDASAVDWGKADATTGWEPGSGDDVFLDTEIKYEGTGAIRVEEELSPSGASATLQTMAPNEDWNDVVELSWYMRLSQQTHIHTVDNISGTDWIELRLEDDTGATNRRRFRAGPTQVAEGTQWGEWFKVSVDPRSLGDFAGGEGYGLRLDDMNLVLFAGNTLTAVRDDPAGVGGVWWIDNVRLRRIPGLVLAEDMESLTGWTNSLATLSLQTDRVEGANSIRGTPVDALPIEIRKLAQGYGDWSKSTLSVYVKFESGHPTSATDMVRFKLRDSRTPGGVNEYNRGTDDGIVVGEWVRIEVNLETATPDQQTSEGCDLTDVDDFIMERPAASFDWLQIDNLQVWPNHGIQDLEVDNPVLFQDGKSYSIQARGVNAAGTDLVVSQANVTNPVAPAGPDDERQDFSLAAVTRLEGVREGDLIAFGQNNLEVIEALVRSIAYGPDLSSTVELVDYAPAVFTAESAAIPSFDPGSSSPVKPTLRGPNEPILDSVVSDESALAFSEAGVLVPRIIVNLGQIVDTEGRPNADEYEVQVRRNDPNPPAGGDDILGDWKMRPRVPATADQLIIDKVDEGVRYDIRFRTRTTAPVDAADAPPGLVSDFITVSQHLVIGGSTPPPTPTDLRVEGGFFHFRVEARPVDFAGFRARVNIGDSENWDQALELSETIITTDFVSLESVPRGPLTLLVRSEDQGGNQSTGTAALFQDLADRLAENVVRTLDDDVSPFFEAGIKRNFTLNGSNELEQITEEGTGDSALFWTGDSNLFWTDDAALFWGVGTFLEMVYQRKVAVRHDDIPTALATKVAVDGNRHIFEYRVDPRSAVHLAESTTNWSDAVHTVALDTTDFVEGLASVQVDAISATSINLVLDAQAELGGVQDWRHKKLRFYFRTNELGQFTATDGLRVFVRINSGADRFRWDFGTDDIAAVDTWYLLEIELMGRSPTAEVAAGVNLDSVESIQFQTNVAGTPTATQIINVDAVEVVDSDIVDRFDDADTTTRYGAFNATIATDTSKKSALGDSSIRSTNAGAGNANIGIDAAGEDKSPINDSTLDFSHGEIFRVQVALDSFNNISATDGFGLIFDDGSAVRTQFRFGSDDGVRNDEEWFTIEFRPNERTPSDAAPDADMSDIVSIRFIHGLLSSTGTYQMWLSALEREPTRPRLWSLWPGRIADAGPFDYEFRLRLPPVAGGTAPALTQFEVDIDYPDKIQFIHAQSIAASGVERLTLDPELQFRVITSVIPVAVNTGSNARIAVVLDKDATNGPSVEVYDDSDPAVRVASDVDAIIQGY